MRNPREEKLGKWKGEDARFDACHSGNSEGDSAQVEEPGGKEDAEGCCGGTWAWICEHL